MESSILMPCKLAIIKLQDFRLNFKRKHSLIHCTLYYAKSERRFSIII